MNKEVNSLEIHDSLDKISENQKETFKFRTNIASVLVEKGDELWRIVKSRGHIQSAFWLDSKGMDVIFSDFFHHIRVNEAMKIITDKKIAVIDASRNRMSVKEEWQDKFNRVVKVAFRKPVYAYYGIIAPQEDEMIKKIYDGGTYQYVIPRFQYYKDQKQWNNIDDYITVVEYPSLMASSWFKRYNYNYVLTE